MACDDCKDKNVATPVYTEASPPAVQQGCETCGSEGNIGGGGVILPPNQGGAGGGNITEVLAGNQMLVDDNSYPGVDSFTVHYNPYTNLTTNLTATPYILGVLQSGLMLFGWLIDEVRLAWSYNKTIAAQALTNDGGLDVPALNVVDRDFTYLNEAIIAKLIFTMTGNDGQGQSGSIKTDTAVVDFGNHILWGDYNDMVNQPESEIVNLLTSLQGQSLIISNTKGRSIHATGGVNRYFFYLLPERLGEVIFSKNNFVGGFYRLKLVSGVLKTELAGGDVETDIVLTNPAGYAEKYYIYQTSQDNQVDPVVPFIIT